MIIKEFFSDSKKLVESYFSKTPEALNTIDMWLPTKKFVLPMVYSKITVKYAKYNCLITGTSATFGFDPSWPKITFIDFYSSLKARFQVAELGNPGSHGEITVESIAVGMGKFTDLDCVQIQGKQLDQMP